MQACRLHQRYFSTASSSFQRNGSSFETTYGADTVTGFMSQDVLRLGDAVIPKQDFAEATTETGQGPVYWRMDGVLGLGFDEAAVNRATPPVYNMMNQGLAEPVFAFYFDNANQPKGSEVTFGGTNPRLYTGDLIPLPIRDKPTWELALTSITFGNWTAELESTGAAIDTGASFIMLPSALSVVMYSITPCARCSRPDIVQTSKDGC